MIGIQRKIDIQRIRLLIILNTFSIKQSGNVEGNNLDIFWVKLKLVINLGVASLNRRFNPIPPGMKSKNIFIIFFCKSYKNFLIVISTPTRNKCPNLLDSDLKRSLPPPVPNTKPFIDPLFVADNVVILINTPARNQT